MEKREGKLVFVECTAEENARIERDGGRYGLFSCVPTDVKGVYRKPFLISETEKPIKGDWYLSPGGILSLHNGTEVLPNGWFKVLVLPEQFSYEELIQIRDGKLKGRRYDKLLRLLGRIFKIKVIWK